MNKTFYNGFLCGLTCIAIVILFILMPKIKEKQDCKEFTEYSCALCSSHYRDNRVVPVYTFRNGIKGYAWDSEKYTDGELFLYTWKCADCGTVNIDISKTSRNKPEEEK